MILPHRARVLLNSLAALAMTLLPAGVLVPTALGTTFDNWDVYTYQNSNCTGVKDPLNFIYEGSSVGFISVALSLTESAPLYWSASSPASDQYFYNTGESPGDQCTRNWYNRASSTVSPRYHTRLDQGSYVPNTGYTTASPMHHDVYAACIPPDKADTFDGARDYAASVFGSAHYILIRSYLGNTMAILQCDGTYVASDGYAYRNTGT